MPVFAPFVGLPAHRRSFICFDLFIQVFESLSGARNDQFALLERFNLFAFIYLDLLEFLLQSLNGLVHLREVFLLPASSSD